MDAVARLKSTWRPNVSALGFLLVCSIPSLPPKYTSSDFIFDSVPLRYAELEAGQTNASFGNDWEFIMDLLGLYEKQRTRSRTIAMLN